MFSWDVHAKTRRRKDLDALHVAAELMRLLGGRIDAATRRLGAFRKFQNISLCVFASLRENLFVDENELSRMVVDSAFRIHSTLGPGLFESVYEVTMAHELRQRGCHDACQRAIR